MKEFHGSEAKEDVQFKIGSDTFTAIAPSKLPGNALLRYVQMVSSGQLLGAHTMLFNIVLDAKSSETFLERLDDKDNPITLTTMAEVANWLIEEVYGGKGTGLL